jgi:endonuclease-3
MSDAYLEKVMQMLETRYGNSLHTGLRHRNTTELFVATLLSAQCSDAQVNRTTPKLFRRFRTFSDYASADVREIKRHILSINFYNTKARNLKRSAQLILRKHDGKVPRTMQGMLSLPGVGRKVANVVLTEGYGIVEGIAVDTHCITVARRLGLSRSRDPEIIERTLMRRVQRQKWRTVSNLFITLGRDTCRAREKECERCVLRHICPSSNRPEAVVYDKMARGLRSEILHKTRMVLKF